MLKSLVSLISMSWAYERLYYVILRREMKCSPHDEIRNEMTVTNLVCEQLGSPFAMHHKHDNWYQHIDYNPNM